VTLAGAAPATYEPDADRGDRVWDNANVVESFPGLTLPLTYSVARAAYAAVYRQACAAIGVGPATLDRHAETFEHLIGLVHGRVYYDVGNWHTVVALLPGFRLNQAFLERMMGARRPDLATPAATAGARLLEHAAVAVCLARRRAWLEHDARGFDAAIAALGRAERDRPVADEPAAALLARFDALWAGALAAWRAPIMNDLFLMVAHGALRRLAERWLGPPADAVVNALLRQGGLPSTAPAEALARIAERARADPAWRAALADVAPVEAWRRARRDPALAGLADEIDAYLERWGDRCPRELHLDQPSYRDDPTALLRAIRGLAERRDGAPGAGPAADGPADAERALRGLGARRLILGLLVRQVRHHLAWRERLRFRRGEVFGLGRRLVGALGETLAREGRLDDPRDVHYLELPEVRALVRAPGSVDAPALAAARRAAYARFAREPAPPDRLEPGGGPLRAAGPAPRPADGVLRGTGAYPGRVRAPCVVVEDPYAAPPVAGRIVVARSTDPGWVPLFLDAAGLLVERGGLLSHSAIVARELGLPTIVAVAGVVDSLATGDVVEMDGASGEVWPPPDRTARARD
jgi:pyruvate,water dikinase